MPGNPYHLDDVRPIGASRHRAVPVVVRRTWHQTHGGKVNIAGHIAGQDCGWWCAGGLYETTVQAGVCGADDDYASCCGGARG